MNAQYQCATITAKDFHTILENYTSCVPSKLQALDIERYSTIPADLNKQTGSDVKAHLSLDQVSTLVDWKLSHGTFRPTLKKLVASNSSATVEETTGAGFQIYTSQKTSDGVKASITKLSELKGIGPATASLLLSVYDPESVPFFSDELFRWCFWSAGAGKGWDRPIKYNPKEFLELFTYVQQFLKRFKANFDKDVSAVDMEKVAYVLGKQGGPVHDRKATPSSSNTSSSAQNKKRKPQELDINDKGTTSESKKSKPDQIGKPTDSNSRGDKNPSNTRFTRSSQRLK